MLEKIKEYLGIAEHYILVVSTLAIAILTYLFFKRGEKITDLQHQIVLNKLDSQLDDAASKSHQDQEAYDASIAKYRKLKESYDKMYQ